MGMRVLFSDTIETLQVNLGLKCNQQCLHCHMESSPERKEMMEWPVMELILKGGRKLLLPARGPHGGSTGT